jgi:hypothetical protein
MKTANICESWVSQHGVAEDSNQLQRDTESLGERLQVSKNRTALAFSSKQSKKDEFFTSCL